jgi:hypothetical protein
MLFLVKKYKSRFIVELDKKQKLKSLTVVVQYVL